jgi:hypothetical protein
MTILLVCLLQVEVQLLGTVLSYETFNIMIMIITRHYHVVLEIEFTPTLEHH